MPRYVDKSCTSLHTQAVYTTRFWLLTPHRVDAQYSQLARCVGSIFRKVNNVLPPDGILPRLPRMQLIPQRRDLSIPDMDDVVLALESLLQAWL